MTCSRGAQVLQPHSLLVLDLVANVVDCTQLDDTVVADSVAVDHVSQLGGQHARVGELAITQKHTEALRAVLVSGYHTLETCREHVHSHLLVAQLFSIKATEGSVRQLWGVKPGKDTASDRRLSFHVSYTSFRSWASKAPAQLTKHLKDARHPCGPVNDVGDGAFRELHHHGVQLTQVIKLHSPFGQLLGSNPVDRVREPWSFLLQPQLQVLPTT